MREDLRPAFAPKQWGPALGITFALLVSACSMSTMEAHTTAAGLAHAVAGESKALIEASAQRAADDAIRPCVEDGAPRATCEEDLDERMSRHRAAAAGQRIFATGVDAFIDEVIVQAGRPEEARTWERATRIGIALLASYADLRALLEAVGIDAPSLAPALRLIGIGGDR